VIVRIRLVHAFAEHDPPVEYNRSGPSAAVQVVVGKSKRPYGAVRGSLSSVYFLNLEGVRLLGKELIEKPGPNNTPFEAGENLFCLVGRNVRSMCSIR